MYGMLLESVQHYVIEEYGEATWIKVLQLAGYRNLVVTHNLSYSDSIMLQVAEMCAQCINTMDADGFLRFFGRCFVRYFSHYGYDRIVKANGRYFRDFLHGVDNIHHQMKFSYPRMVSPSLTVQAEDPMGAVLHYRSSRVGFTQYLIGQLYEVAEAFYKTPLTIRILTEAPMGKGEGVHVQFRLDFRNSAYVESATIPIRGTRVLPPIVGSTLLQLFPFCIVFDCKLRLKYVGNKLRSLLHRDLIGLQVDDHFRLSRPRVAFTWNNIISLSKVVFELEAFPNVVKKRQYFRAREGSRKTKVKTISSITKNTSQQEVDTIGDNNPKCPIVCPSMPSTSAVIQSPTDSNGQLTLYLKGQMKYLEEWNAVMFLCAPLINSLEEMEQLQMYLNDLSLHDLSREMLLLGWQHAGRLVHAYEKQEERTVQLSDNLNLLDKWQQKSDELLYSMIPKSVADRLRAGDDPITTCKTFDEVSILFIELIGFDVMCANVQPMESVAHINRIFTLFDEIIDHYDVYKVETIGTIYMLVGGAPQERPDHLRDIGQAALRIVRETDKLQAFSYGDKVSIRAGIHKGPVVAGVVGMKTFRYCFFGDTVNTASRMQSNSLPGQILVSEVCHHQLVQIGFQTKFRDLLNVKGKGIMKTFWLIDYSEEDTTETAEAAVK